MITTNEADFRSRFENPTEIIQFDALKDGTVFVDVDGHNLYWTGISVAGELVIYEDAWSDNYLIRSVFTGSPTSSQYHVATK